MYVEIIGINLVVQYIQEQKIKIYAIFKPKGGGMVNYEMHSLRKGVVVNHLTSES